MLVPVPVFSHILQDCLVTFFSNLFQILEIILGAVKVCESARDIRERLPLHIAAEAGSLDCILTLSKQCRFSSHLNERDEHAKTPLHLAANNGHE